MGKEVRIEGLISRRVIKLWLKHYEDLESDSRVLNITGRSSGPAAKDGVKAGRLNKLMLDEAIAELPPVLKVCVEYKWLKPATVEAITNKTGIPRSTYYRRCDKAVDFLYYHINGVAAGVKDLVEKILD